MPKALGAARGAPEANPTIISSHSRLEDSQQIAVEVIRSGEYEISLTQSRPPQKAPIGYSEAMKKIGNIELSKMIEPNASAVVFRTRLEAGDLFLKTWLTDEKTRKKDDAGFVIFRYLRP